MLQFLRAIVSGFAALGIVLTASTGSSQRPQPLELVQSIPLPDVRGRIDRKLMMMILPKDLFYQILDGIRSLTHYDHSSALFIRDEGKAALRLVAEQIAEHHDQALRPDQGRELVEPVGEVRLSRRFKVGKKGQHVAELRPLAPRG